MVNVFVTALLWNNFRYSRISHDIKEIKAFIENTNTKHLQIA